MISIFVLACTSSYKTIVTEGTADFHNGIAILKLLTGILAFKELGSVSGAAKIQYFISCLKMKIYLSIVRFVETPTAALRNGRSGEYRYHRPLVVSIPSVKIKLNSFLHSQNSLTFKTMSPLWVWYDNISN